MKLAHTVPQHLEKALVVSAGLAEKQYGDGEAWSWLGSVFSSSILRLLFHALRFPVVLCYSISTAVSQVLVLVKRTVQYLFYLIFQAGLVPTVSTVHSPIWTGYPGSFCYFSQIKSIP